MGEIAVFTEEVAYTLMARGFVCLRTTDKAWMFEDEPLLLEALEEIMRDYQ